VTAAYELFTVRLAAGELQADAFRGLSNLTKLVLKTTGITAIHADAFRNLSKLAYLDLSGNSLATAALPSAGLLHSLAALQTLEVGSAELSEVGSLAANGLRDDRPSRHATPRPHVKKGTRTQMRCILSDRWTGSVCRCRHVGPLAVNRVDGGPSLYATPSCRVKRGAP